MSNSFNAPRFGLGLSEERKAAIQRENRLKQELYAQQKKIQFSNLLERSSQTIGSYIESQNNIFFSSGHSKSSSSAPHDSDVSGQENAAQYDRTNSSSTGGASSEVESDDRDGFDYFYRRAFSPSSKSVNMNLGEEDDWAFEPVVQIHESLHDHLLKQIRLDGKYSSISPSILEYSEKIIDNLDSAGYLRNDPNVTSPFKTAADSGSTPIAYPDYDEHHERAIDDFDSLFGIVSSPEQRFRAKQALDDYFDSESKSKISRRLAREEFDEVVGRKTTKEERELAKKYLDQLDVPSNASLDPLETLFSSSSPSHEVEEALKLVQSLDPPGVGARNLQESLLLRLRPDVPHANELRRLVSNHFDDFCKKRIGALSEKSGISAKVLEEIYELSFPFYPSPEQVFGTDRAPTRWIQPEIVVEEKEPGRWSARLDDAYDNVELDPHYRKMLFSKRVDQKTKEYLRRQLVEAQALLDALKNRNSTLLRVAKAVVDFQFEFFANPSSFPRPLTQQQIADKLGLDSSTVSRACNDKWLATPRGFISFKTLFPKAVSGDVTRDNVAELINKIVAQEDKDKPLSDEEIAAELIKSHQIKVSRKTVQEHRDRLQIPNSRARKRTAKKK